MADTICAVATPPGAGGIGVVRVSGPLAPQLANLLLGACPPPRQATLTRFRDVNGSALDEGLALYFPAPASFTGEDVLELQGHGSPVVLDRLLKALIANGARLARPGEFTERAFLNGKIDLVQAEAVADLIESASEEAARAAFRTLTGHFSETLNAFSEQLIGVRARIEAALDFPDEAEDAAEHAALKQALIDLRARLMGTVKRAREGRLLREGAQVVIVGAPNAGKSTLLNALAGHEAAIVSPCPGTTRDLVRETIVLEGLTLRLTDTAGLREARDPIEREGVRRAEEAFAQADCALLVVDDSDRSPTDVPAIPVPVLTVLTKIDISKRPPGAGPEGFAVCAPSGEGLDDLRAALRANLLGDEPSSEGTGVFSARRRHLAALEAVDAALARALDHHEDARAELAAEELRRAHESLGEITGRFTSDDLLGRIFGSFCIGK